LNENLRAKTINALTWSFLESVVMRGLQFVTGIILARLLFPEQFGLIGMLVIFMALARTLSESGFGLALIQKRDITHTDICSIFYLNVFVGVILAGLLCLLAPLIAAFFHQPLLTPLTRVLSLTIVFNSLGLIQDTLLSKDINFKAHTIRSLIAGITSGALGISLAVAGFGVWSIAAQYVADSFLRATILWLLSPWRPALIFSFRALREMFRFGSRMLCACMLNQVFENIYFVVIGKLFSAADLGLFTRANTLQSHPSQTLSEVVGRVTFPVFAKTQDDPAGLKKALKKALTTLVLLNFPLLIGIAVTARPLVIVVLGQKWGGCIHYLQLLCVVGLIYPLHSINLNILMSLGRSDLFLRLEIIKKLLIVANIAVTYRMGIPAIIYGMIVTSLFSYYLNCYYTRTLIGYRLGEQLKELLPYLASAMVMGIAVVCTGFLGFHSYPLELLSQVIVGVIVYVSLCQMFRLPAFLEMMQELRDRISSTRSDKLAGNLQP
jgi:O-antigen/teichoic acid export membrane protein